MSSSQADEAHGLVVFSYEPIEQVKYSRASCGGTDCILYGEGASTHGATIGAKCGHPLVDM
ncbi:hypothetical protein PAXRUDRAFT_825679 [Paxillus rubicundulus Ve08.2h10]|uniref:Uncharacterized protein n=1 Tax=Paxillus rubicundulus Ve08.2h10 TaxID=930991 RepID=A0A0D0E0B4_9AGAM|nr:hypothetical protein PAXRUDRAFT_825679 [Paxillus rubicundulus Ve08.2h10]